MTRIALLAFTMAFTAHALAQTDLFVVPADEPAQSLNLVEAIGQTPRTVYIPAQYYSNKKGALFIDGQRFETQTGAADVSGFIVKDGQYVIAVRDRVDHFTEKASGSNGPPAKEMFTEEELRKLPPEMRLKALQIMAGGSKPDGEFEVVFGKGQADTTLFYLCTTRSSCRIARIVRGTPQLQITADAIWYSDPSLGGSRVGNPQYFTEYTKSYSGIDINGKRLDGPAAVLDAVPLPNASWLSKKLDGSDSLKVYYSWTIRSQDGSERQLLQRSFDFAADYQTFETALSIVIDEAPISPSAQYGVVPIVSGGVHPLANTAAYFYRPVCARTASRNNLSSDSSFMTLAHRSTAALLASQMAIVPLNRKILAVGQATNVPDSPFGSGIILGSAELDCQDSSGSPDKIAIKPFAQIKMDTGALSFLPDKVLTGGLGSFVHLRYPKGNIILLTEKMRERTPVPGIQVEDGKRISLKDAEWFLNRYGLIQ